MADVLATSFLTPNYSGMLFNRGNTRTPLLTAIGGKQKLTNSVEFVTGQEYVGGGDGSQPSISEAQSLTAPDATIGTRAQNTNVTQIFMETVGISDAKMANMGTLSGINIAGQTANPATELDFQIGLKMQKIARDIEYTFINGVYNKATSDTTTNQTRGLIEATTTNVTDLAGYALNIHTVGEMLKKMYGSNAPTEGVVLWCDATTLFQLTEDARVNGMTIVPSSREVNGLAVDTLITPMGAIGVRLGECLPTGTALVLNMNVISPVHQYTPNKGNFYMEELAKTGAGQKYQIFGQMGLDHGPEWYHGKFTNMSTEFVPAEYSRIVKIADGSSTMSVTASAAE